MADDTSWKEWHTPSPLAAAPPPMLSMIHPATALQARASEYHTMRVQLRGKCRYTLYPPRSAEALKVFPHIHVSYSQSQKNLYDMSSTLKGYSATLQPGEVLYVPPYWYAHVESLSFAAFVDVPSISEEQVTLTELMYMYIKNLKISREEEKVVVAQVQEIRIVIME